MNQELRPGKSYTALVYDPKPSAIEMRAAGTAYPREARRYVSFDVARGRARCPVDRAPFWGRPVPRSIADRCSGTPYDRDVRLALRLAAGAPTP